MTRRDPIATLERLPGWWRGAAAIRVEEAAQHATWSDEARRHLALAAQYERRAEDAQ